MYGKGMAKLLAIWMWLMNCTQKQICFYEFIFLEELKEEPLNGTLEDGNVLKN